MPLYNIISFKFNEFVVFFVVFCYFMVIEKNVTAANSTYITFSKLIYRNIYVLNEIPVPI